MPQKSRLVGLDVAKNRVDACIRPASLRMSQPSTPEGQAELIAWLRANRVGRVVMEASGGYERSWAEALRAAGVEAQIVIRNAFAISPKRPGDWPRTTRSTPTRSPGSPRPFPPPTLDRTIPRARRSTGW